MIDRMNQKRVTTPLQIKLLVVAAVTIILIFVLLVFSVHSVLIMQFAQMEQQIKTAPPDQVAILLAQGRALTIRQIYLFFLGIIAVTIGGQFYFLHRSIIQPLHQISRDINAIGNRGDLTRRVTPAGDREFIDLVRTLNKVLSQLELTQQRTQQYRTVVEKTSTGIVLVDTSTRRLVDANTAFQHLSGYTSQEVLSLTLYELLSTAPAEIDSWLAAITEETQAEMRELSLFNKNGEAIAVEISPIFLQGGEHSLYCLIMHDVRARKQMQQALLATMPDNFIRLSADGTYLEVHLSGDPPIPYPAEAMIGRNIRDFLPPQTADLVLSAIQRTLASKQIESFEYERIWNGERWWLDTRILASGPNEAVAIIHNVTKQRLAEETIRYQASLVDNVSDAIISTDLQMALISWNQAAEKIYGYTFAEVCGKRFRDVVRYEYSSGAHGQVTTALQQTGAWQGEQLHYTRNGTPLYMWVSLTYLYDHKGQPTSIVGVNRDITERKHAERLLLLAQQSESLRMMAGGIAHDFNNLLTDVLAQNTLALRKLPADSKAATHISKAIKATERTADLTRQLLAYTGQGAFLIETLNLNQLIQENRGLINAVIPKHIRLELHLAPTLASIDIDRGHAQQVMMNLILNGVEAIQTEAGWLQITTGEQWLDQAPAALEPEAFQPGHYVFLRVADNGRGMSAAILERIFEPYFTTKEHGSGLGLAATLGIMRRYRGGLSVESKEESGTSFTLFFPLAKQAVLNDHQQPATAQQVGGLILVIDDEAAIREAMSDLLASEGYTVIGACDGYEGLAQFQQYQHQIALVFLDMKMPGMNGVQTLAALRALTTTTPVVLCSGYSETEVSTSTSGLGITTFLQKPFDIDTLFSVVNDSLIGRRRQTCLCTPVNPTG